MKHGVRVDVINLGDELLLGLRDNGHLSYLGRELKRHGLEIRRNFVVRDNAEDIQQVFKNAWEDADIVITTGGLGPTSDDLTRETIAKALGVKLEFVDSVRVELEARFARLRRTVTANNLKQCYVLDGAEALPNPNGTAPGILFKQDGKLLIMLPGPGNELHRCLSVMYFPRLPGRKFLCSGGAVPSVTLFRCG